MSVTDLANEVISSLKEDKLIQLTNDVQNATTIDQARLETCCRHAIGKFRLVTGILEDLDNFAHAETLVAGAVYYLEKYVNRDSSIVRQLKSEFYNSMGMFEKNRKWLPATNSNLSPTQEREGTRPDMDRGLKVFRGSRGIPPQSTTAPTDNEYGN